MKLPLELIVGYTDGHKAAAYALDQSGTHIETAEINAALDQAERMREALASAAEEFSEIRRIVIGLGDPRSDSEQMDEIFDLAGHAREATDAALAPTAPPEPEA